MSPSQASETCASASSATSAISDFIMRMGFEGVKKARVALLPSQDILRRLNYEDVGWRGSVRGQIHRRHLSPDFEFFCHGVCVGEICCRKPHLASVLVHPNGHLAHHGS